MWDAMKPFRKWISRPLDDSTIQQALKIGRDWKKNGYQTAAMLYNSTKWLDRKPDLAPRYWKWVLTAITRGFEKEALDARDARHESAIARTPPTQIDTPTLPLSAQREWDERQFGDVARGMALSKKANAG